MDRLKALEGYSFQELVTELRRRIAEVDEARALLAGSGTGSSKGPKNPRMSEAKRKYWESWHQYKAEHPEATKAEWLRIRKRGKR